MADNTHADVKKLSFEKAIEELESIVKRLEEGKVPLEESVAIYERGESLKRRCQELLQQAEARLITELLGYEQAVLSGCTLEPNQNQLDAMCSLAWNIGIAGLLRSTVLKCHNRGDAQSASRAFGLWNKAGGREWAGLTRRRAAEAALYLEPAPGMVPRNVLPFLRRRCLV